MLGGAMRQAGILAAAGLYALEHHRRRLADDHANAAFIARSLAGAPGFSVDLSRVHTNIVLVDVDPAHATAAQVVAAAGAQRVLMYAVGPHRIRLVTHLDVDRAACTRAVEVLSAAVAR
jgi:threonine aldolase